MDIAPVFFTFGLNVATAVLALGISWGVYKTKIAVMVNDYNILLSKHDRLEKTVLDNADANESCNHALDKEINKKIDDSIREVNRRADAAIKDIEKSIWSLETKFVSREVYINYIPTLTEDLNKLRIEVNALPSKLSNELTKTFSEEYQKIISVIVNKGHNIQ